VAGIDVDWDEPETALDSRPAGLWAILLAIAVLCACIATATIFVQQVFAGVGLGACALHEAREGSAHANWVPGSVADVQRLAEAKGLRVTLRPDHQTRSQPGTVTKVSDCAPPGADVVLYVASDQGASS
jgi:hypothetical protein